MIKTKIIVNLSFRFDIFFFNMYYIYGENVMISIAVDGPSGSGKGALAEGLAKKLNLIHLDTGAIFRGIACGVLEANFIDPTEDEINNLLPKINIRVEFENEKQLVYLNNTDITSKLRQEEVSKLASKVSVFSKVREKYLEIVRKFASENDCIIDGRDITSVVLPNADFKIFLFATEEIRARRRYEENISKNISCTYEEVLQNLKERDYRDSHREIAPLKVVADATIVDNTELTIEQTINICYDLILKKLNKGKSDS